MPPALVTGSDAVENGRQTMVQEKSGSGSVTAKSAESISIAEQDSPAFTLYEIFGWVTLTVLIGSVVILIGVLWFLWFLWLATYSNSAWHTIALNGWIPRAATLSSAAIRTSLALSAGTATSMLAALIVENVQVILIDFAAVSSIRNSNSGPYELLWYTIRSFWYDQRRWNRILLPIFLLLLAITSFLAQFASTALVSDLNSGVIPGHEQISAIPTNFNYSSSRFFATLPIIARATAWTYKPTIFPAFAEYREPPSSLSPTGTDTGLTLRAFLPLNSESARTKVQRFSGKATVGDFSVKCEAPQLENVKSYYDTGGYIGFEGNFIHGKGRSQPFEALIEMTLSDLETATVITPWPLSFTSLGAFSHKDINYRRPRVFGRPAQSPLGKIYLVSNITKGTIEAWQNAFAQNEYEIDPFGRAIWPVKQSFQRREWLDLDFTGNRSAVISVSACYAFTDFALLPVIAIGDSVRTEPTSFYNTTTKSWDDSLVRLQLGQSTGKGRTSNLPNRGLLSLVQKRSWVPTGEDDDRKPAWILALLDMAYTFEDGQLPYYSPSDTNYTAILSAQGSGGASEQSSDEPVKDIHAHLSQVPRVHVDPSISILAQEITRNGGSVAFALQSILTVLAAAAFYDQLPLFTNVSNVTTISLESVTMPTRKAGLIAVTTVAVSHLCLILAILWLFIRRTTVSAIRNTWQVVAQSAQCAPPELVEHSALVTDDKINEKIATHGWQKTFIGLRRAEDRDGVVPVLSNQSTFLRNCDEDLEFLNKRHM